MRIRSLIWLFFSVALLTAQRLPVQTYTTRDGLPSNLVTTVFQDSKGYLWVGTDEGVGIFDGDKFRVLRIGDSSVVGYVNDIVESRTGDGTFWLATNAGGLIRYTGGVRTRFSFGDDPDANSVNSIIESADGSLWCATDAGIFLFDGREAKQITKAERNTYAKFCLSLDGSIWYFNDHSLQLFDPVQRTLTEADIPGVPRDSLTYLSALADSSIAIMTRSPSGAVISIVKHRSLQTVMTLHSFAALFTVLQPDGSYLIGTFDGLVSVRKGTDGPVYRSYTTEHGLPINDLTIGFQDRERNIWFGSFGRGLTKWEDQRFTQFPLPGMSGRGARDAHGHLWIPSTGGLFELWDDVSGQWNKQLHVLSTRGRPIIPVSVAEDALHRLWIIDRDGSLHALSVEGRPFAPSKLTVARTLSEQEGYPRALSVTLLIDSRQILWYCILTGGLVGVDVGKGPQRAALFRYPSETMLRDVRDLYEDRDGSIWALGFEPVNRIIRRSGSRYWLDSTDAVLTSLPPVPLRAVARTGDGTLWFGSRYQGLYYRSDSANGRLTTADGLISDQMGSLAAVGRNGLLIGTHAGLMVMEGFPHPRFTPMQQFAQSHVVTLLSGKVPLAAVTRFEVSLFEVLPDTAAPQFPMVQFTGVSVNGVQRPTGDQIRLGAGENTLTIDFTAVSFRNSSAIRFQYRLEPLEEEWGPITANRSVTYANLGPGSYMFMVRVLNQQGMPSEISSLLPVIVDTPLWLRWWFLSGISLLIIGIVIAVERFRVRRLIEIEKIRSRIAADLHDDIGSGLTRIALLTEMIQRQSPSADAGTELRYSVGTLTEKVGSISRELVDAMSDVVWSIDPKNSSMERLLQRVQTFAVEVCEAKEIRLAWEVDAGVERLAVGSESIRAVLLVAKEALTNVVRHSGARSAGIAISTSAGALVLTIRDDGRGFDPEALSRMNGLTNMRTRIEKIGGVFSIRTIKGNGTVIIATIPLQH